MSNDFIANLSDLYSLMRANKLTKKELKEGLQGIEKVVNSYVNRGAFTNVPYSETDIQNIYLLVEVLQFIYSTGIIESPISDSDYDVLHSILERYDTDGSLDVVGYPIPEGKEIVNHKYTKLRGSLHKVYYLSDDEKSTNPSRKYFSEWCKSIDKAYHDKTGKHISLDKTPIAIMPKFDGVSVILEYSKDNILERALLRGEVERNETVDISPMLKKYSNAKALGYGGKHDTDFAIKCELMMSNENFEKYNKTYGTTYKQSRSIVSSIVNSNEPDERCDYIEAIPLRIQHDGDDEIHLAVACDVLMTYLGDTKSMREFADKSYTVTLGPIGKHHYRCDGIVIRIMDEEISKVLGHKGAYEESEVAYKFTEEITTSKVEDVEFTVGVYGNLTPVIKIKPVVLKGNTIERISLGSLARFNELDLSKGDTVKILYDIIPYLTVDKSCKKNPKGRKLKAPVFCPECNSELFNDGVHLKCVNPDCGSIKLGRILNYCRKMDIKHISYATVLLLHERGYLDNIEDLYKLKDNQKAIAVIDGFGPKRIKNIIDELERKNEIYDYELLGVVGIEGCSKKTFISILREVSLTELFRIVKDDDVEALTEIKGIKEKTARKIIKGITDNIDTIKVLRENLTIKNAPKETRFSVAFTKVRDPELEDFIEDLGGVVDDNVTEKTTFLVVPSMDTDSGKVKKAKKYGITIIPINSAREYFNNLVV